MKFWATYGTIVFFCAYLFTQLAMIANGRAVGLEEVVVPFVVSACIASVVVSIGIFGSSSHSGYGGGE
ncbi:MULTISPECIES: hypothetical protein [Bacillus]|uniref:hypothetical protein n=1 Tax=Bacillus TaxID=1386 RepID=UPI001FF47A4D|nr:MULTISPECIES: hypothetical protein [Bacillus]UOY86831.1 hypothetical protein MW696_11970 [Bacillus glycinifermentans]